MAASSALLEVRVAYAIGSAANLSNKRVGQ